MTKFMITAKKFFGGEEAATTIEYGIMFAVIAVACVASVRLLGGSHSTKIGANDTEMTR